MWNIRMRASRQKGKKDRARTDSQRSAVPDIHISGAEAICYKRELHQIASAYIDRAITHPKGKPDKIVITIEQLIARPRVITALPVVTVKCRSSGRAEEIIKMLCRRCGISEKSIRSALGILRSSQTMRGAGLVMAASGRRAEPDRARGVRASRFGISRTAAKALSACLSDQDIDTQTVREALMLSSKVLSCRDVMAEVCISDDPDYTTGYVASADLGYVRIPNIKKRRDTSGGRVFFLREDTDIQGVIRYLEKTPVIINNISPCLGEKGIDEIIDRNHQ